MVIELKKPGVPARAAFDENLTHHKQQVSRFLFAGGDSESTVDLTWDAIRRGVQSYVAEQATASSGPWTQCYVGRASKCTVTGLTSGTQYWFQVRAIGAAGPSAWSDPATKRAT